VVDDELDEAVFWSLPLELVLPVPDDGTVDGVDELLEDVVDDGDVEVVPVVDDPLLVVVSLPIPELVLPVPELVLPVPELVPVLLLEDGEEVDGLVVVPPVDPGAVVVSVVVEDEFEVVDGEVVVVPPVPVPFVSFIVDDVLDPVVSLADVVLPVPELPALLSLSFLLQAESAASIATQVSDSATLFMIFIRFLRCRTPATRRGPLPDPSSMRLDRKRGDIPGRGSFQTLPSDTNYRARSIIRGDLARRKPVGRC
jgi:hypothetical protein